MKVYEYAIKSPINESPESFLNRMAKDGYRFISLEQAYGWIFERETNEVVKPPKQRSKRDSKAKTVKPKVKPE
jgi:hypothetical protein